MTSRFDILMESFAPQNFEQKVAIKKQRKTILTLIALAGIIIISFLAALITLSLQQKHLSINLQELQQNIQQTQTKIDSYTFLKKINLNKLKIQNILIKIMSNDNPKKKLISLDLSNTTIQKLKRIRTPHLQQLLIGGCKHVFINQSYFPALSRFEPSESVHMGSSHFGLQQFVQLPKNIVVMDNNTFQNIKNLTIRNITISEFSFNKFPEAEVISFVNTSTLQFILQGAPNLKQLLISDGNNVLQSLIINDLPLLKDFQLASNNQLTLNIASVSLYRQQTMRIPRVKIIRIRNTSIKQITKTYKELVKLQFLECYHLQTVNLTYFPQIKYLTIINSSLKSIIAGDDFKAFPKSFLIANTTIEQIKHLQLNVQSFQIDLNDEITVIYNNSFVNMRTFFMPQKVIKIQLNRFNVLIQFSFTRNQPYMPFLESFCSNQLPMMNSLQLSSGNLSSMTQNHFSSLKSLNISNNKFNDQSIMDVLNKNEWNINLQLIDLRNNNISKKDEVYQAFRQKFQNAIIHV